MAKHLVFLELDVFMDEMDGTPEESAEVLLSLDVLGKVIELLKQEGYEARFTDYIVAEEAPSR